MYEIHISVPREEERFLSFCMENGIKVACLHLSNGQKDLMTSVKVKSLPFVAMEGLRRTIEKEFEITRFKIEAAPFVAKQYVYLEAHFDGPIPGLPSAVNMMKTDLIHSATFRRKGYTIMNFTEIVNKLAADNGLPNPDIEAIILDTNENWDKEWIDSI